MNVIWLEELISYFMVDGRCDKRCTLNLIILVKKNYNHKNNKKQLTDIRNKILLGHVW